MIDKCGVLSERLPTDVTGMVFLACMCALMDKQITALVEFFSTDNTGFSPVWLSWCDSRESLLATVFPHISQTKHSSPVWDLLCRDKEDR
jgi:hypothetical protein